MTAFTISMLTLLAYLTGSVPFGLLLAKTRGVDIRNVGSGNIGATNVLRTLGKPLGITCFVLDVLKGYLPAAL
ncbi:MAG TPA: glycerol-3-phosphate acyltransferase, partial [Tichowtungia sp.]|nr:glycerol-3-phosphate acyltransferase [Tichowtungia sp.]